MPESQDSVPVSSVVSPEAQPVSPVSRKAVRLKTFRFIVVFMVSVLLLLVGYEAGKQSVPNDWYLLHVAKSTAWLLRFVGYSCTVGGAERLKGREGLVRASTTAWSVGAEAPEQAPATANTAPLTSWEAWEYLAAGGRHERERTQAALDAAMNDTKTPEPERSKRIGELQGRMMQLKTQEIGPFVSFVWKASPERRLTDVRAVYEQTQSDATLPEEIRAQRLRDLRGRITALEKEVQAAASNGKAAREEKVFPFVVVPDCGAVQSMAIFFAAVLAFPASWWRRLLGLLVGIPALYWVNAFRLCCLAVIGAWDAGGARFKFAHEYVWQGIYIVFVVALWMGWVELLVRRRQP